MLTEKLPQVVQKIQRRSFTEGAAPNNRFLMQTKQPSMGQKMPSRFAKLERSQNLASKDGLTESLGADAADDIKLKPMLIGHSENPEPFRIILSLLCLCSINGTTKSTWQHIHLQGLLTILSPLSRSTIQKKGFLSKYS